MKFEISWILHISSYIIIYPSDIIPDLPMFSLKIPGLHPPSPPLVASCDVRRRPPGIPSPSPGGKSWRYLGENIGDMLKFIYITYTIYTIYYIYYYIYYIYIYVCMYIELYMDVIVYIYIYAVGNMFRGCCVCIDTYVYMYVLGIYPTITRISWEIMRCTVRFNTNSI